MNRLPSLAAIVAAVGFGALNLVDFQLGRMMAPADAGVDAAAYAAAGVILALALAAAWMAVRQRRRAGVIVVAAILAVSFLPRAVDAVHRDSEARADRAEGAAMEASLLAGLKAGQADVAARIAAKRPYGAEEALDLLNLIEGADLSWRGFPDHTPEAFALLDAALAGSVLDPNVRSAAGVPLFLGFYDVRIKPTAPRLVEKRDWEIEKRVVAHGADLTDPAAA